MTIQPALSLLVPTFNRQSSVDALLAALQTQTLPAQMFELILVDDGSATPVRVPADTLPFFVRVVRRENAGPAAARNSGLEHCRAPTTLILNDDAVPAPGLLQGHLRRQRELSSPTAVLGTFRFTSDALESPFTQVLQGSDLLFAFSGLRPDEDLPWQYFWTCNLSLPTEAILRLGGFDERFDRAVLEDCELGYRWEKAGFRLVYDPQLEAGHAHRLTPDGYFRRLEELGRAQWKMYDKHKDLALLGPNATSGRELLSAARWTFESLRESAERLRETLAKAEVDGFGETLGKTQRESIATVLGKLGAVPRTRGLLEEATGRDPLRAVEASPKLGTTTSIIVVSHNALDQTHRCLDHLRASAEGDHLTEIIFVDNGSTDGTAEYLDKQADVRLIKNLENLGAPKARNQGIEAASGDQLVFMDNDVMVSPGWLGRMLYHLHASPVSGCVGCLSDRAAQHQQLAYPGDSSLESVTVFADERADTHRRQFRHQVFLTSFLMMVRREVVEDVGGFDELFSPWGFEDDDYSFRSHLAGYDNRVALDVFVRHEAYQSAQKTEDHTDLLYVNWQRFREKWNLPHNAAYGDKSGLAEMFYSEPASSVYRKTSSDPAGAKSGRSRAERRRATRADATTERRAVSRAGAEATTSTRLTLCLIARNEEGMLGPCLESVKGVVDEIVVVDTGSSDRTVEIAEAYGAKVIHFAWIDDFAAARNAAVAEVSEGYVLQLDADERLSAAARSVIRFAVDKGGFDGAQLPLFNAASIHASEDEILVEGKTVESGGVLLPRLMRWTPDLRWEGIVHEHTGQWGARHNRWVNLPAPILHMGAVAEYREARNKNERNRTLLRRACEDDPTNPMTFCYLGEELAKIGEIDEAVEVLRHAWGLLTEARTESRPTPSSIPTASALSAILTKRRAFAEVREILSQAESWDGAHPNLTFLRARNAWYEASLMGGDSAQGLLEDCLVWCHDARGFADMAFNTPTIGGAVSFQTDYIEACALNQLGYPAQALVAAERSLAERPRALETLLAKAEAMILSGEAEQALKDLARMLKPDVPDPWILSAWAGYQFGAAEDVRPMVEQARRALDADELLVPHRLWILLELEAELDPLA
jgi:GT2 family glycosyltransferase/tetratricopeptide (TPR) repeat protein